MREWIGLPLSFIPAEEKRDYSIVYTNGSGSLHDFAQRTPRVLMIRNYRLYVSFFRDQIVDQSKEQDE